MLADVKNYHDAAQKLFITQPALSKRIKSLEDELELTLFIRGRHGAALTPAGEKLLSKVSRLIDHTDELMHLAHNLAKGKTGELAIGFGISSIKLAPDLVANFQKIHTDINVSLEDIPSSQQIIGLLEGKLQLGFMRIPVEPPLKGLTLKSESLAIAVRRDDLESLKQAIAKDYKSLSAYPLLKLINDRGPNLNHHTERFLAFNEVKMTIRQEARDIQTLLALVAAGVGIALVPESAARISPAGTGIIPLHGPYTQWDVAMVWNTLKEDKLRDVFIAMVKNGLVL